MNYYSLLRHGEDDYLEMDKECDRCTSRKDRDYLRFAPDLKWTKAERIGDEQNRRIELG